MLIISVYVNHNAGKCIIMFSNKCDLTRYSLVPHFPLVPPVSVTFIVDFNWENSSNILSRLHQSFNSCQLKAFHILPHVLARKRFSIQQKSPRFLSAQYDTRTKCYWLRSWTRVSSSRRRAQFILECNRNSYLQLEIEYSSNVVEFKCISHS